jgi:glycosyltransferase involved in cell wall biosynthesis
MIVDESGMAPSAATRHESPTVTIVIPTHNRLRYLMQSVASVGRQTYQDWELIIVDDQSEDGTRGWLRRLDDPQARTVLLSRHSERSAARNRGLAEARGEFVLFLDDDDRLHLQALERLVSALRRHPRAVAAVGAKAVFDNHRHVRRASHPRVRLERDVWADVFVGWYAGCGQVLWRAEVVRRVGGWDERLFVAEDQDLLLRAAQIGPFAFIPPVVLFNRVHAGQWRPVNVRSTEERIRKGMVEGLVGDRRAQAGRLDAARRTLEKAARAYVAKDGVKALRAYGQVLWRSPELERSPLTGPAIWAGFAKSAVMAVGGRRLFEHMRWIKSTFRGAMHRAPEATRSSTRDGADESDPAPV